MTDEFSIIGKPHPKVDSMGKVTGETQYADDIVLPRMLHCKLLRSPLPHARIVHIDTSKAEAMPGVHAIITGEDVPIKFGILPVSQDEEALAVEKVRFVGDPVAAVAAVDEETAEAALELIEVEYEQLPTIMSVQDALDEKEVFIHEYGDEGNIHKLVSLEFGDVEEGFAEADHIREDIIFYQGNTHLAMEEHASVAHYAANGRLTLWSSTQTPHYVHRAMAKTLELPPSRIRIIAAPVGGGFGGKSDPFNHEVAVAKLSMITGRPVKVTLTREEVFYCHRGRHPVLMWVRTGVKSDGEIVAMHFKSFLDGGGFGSYGVASTYYTGALQTITYKIKNYKFEGMRAFTNKPPCGPKRGHGTPQPRHALEIHIDKIAEDLGIDPVAMRLNHMVEDNSQVVNHLTITTCGLGECIEAAVEASGYREKIGKLPPGKGIALAAGAYLSGAGLPIYWNKMPHSGVQIKIDRGGGVTVFCGSTDIGQGSDSVLAYVVAEMLGVELESVTVVTADTDLTPVDLGSYSSRVTLMTGNAAIEAGARLREMLDEVACERLEIPRERLAAMYGQYYDVANPENVIAFTELVGHTEARFGTLGSVGSYRPPRRGGKFRGAGVGPTPAYTYSVAVVEVDCDAGGENLAGPRRRPLPKPGASRGAGRRQRLYGPQRNLDGRTNLPQGRTQNPLDARL
jgi:4-hydroxybenzoyl-CoA reductase alpha subunit